jgi:DNA-binding XRE family transcriptional regulator
MANGPFAAAAMELAGRGLAVVPCGGGDGKIPLITWAKWRRPPGRAFLEKLIQTHGGGNIGVLAGLSNLTIVDIDDAAVLDSMLERFGPTPLVIETPSGGRHCYYRAAGEGCHNLRGDGLAVDVKGVGGFVVAPPSVRPSGPHAGTAYRFFRGSWDDLPALSKIKAGALPAARSSPRYAAPGAVIEGNRNNSLFRYCLAEARGCDSEAQLLDMAAVLNTELASPLSDSELCKVVASAWYYESNGLNRSGRGAYVMVTLLEFDILAPNPDALALLHLLRFAHGAREEPFAINPEGMQKSGVLQGWGVNKYRATRKWLVEKGFLRITHAGGSGAGDPRFFKLAEPAIQKGSETVGNITNTPPSLSYAEHAEKMAGRRMKRLAHGGELDLVALAGGEPPLRRIDPKIFAAKLRAARTARGVTQAEIASQAGITRAALANIERATYPASPALQRRLGGILTELAA